MRCLRGLVTMAINLGMTPIHQQVLRTTELWLDTVTSGRPTAANETAALYMDGSVLWGTVSEQLRTTQEEIREYFEYFASLPELHVTKYKPFVRVHGDFAFNDGYYEFTFKNEDGIVEEKKARFTFVYNHDATSDKWMIIDHHSSVEPKSPNHLMPATSDPPPLNLGSYLP